MKRLIVFFTALLFTCSAMPAHAKEDPKGPSEKAYEHASDNAKFKRVEELPDKTEKGKNDKQVEDESIKDKKEKNDKEKKSKKEKESKKDKSKVKHTDHEEN